MVNPIKMVIGLALAIILLAVAISLPSLGLKLSKNIVELLQVGCFFLAFVSFFAGMIER